MSSFTSKLYITKTDKPGVDKLTRSFKFYLGNENARKIDGMEIKVPRGFETNYASIPRWLWSVIGHPSSGKWDKAAVLHDYLYAIKILPKFTADAVFYDAMRIRGVKKWRAALFWLAVFLFGKEAWNDL